MPKKYLAAVGAVLALVLLASAPASAAQTLVSDSFSKTGTSQWETDRYEPDEWDTSENMLYIAVGKSGYRNNRPVNQRDKYYSYQGRKLEISQSPQTNTWTATIKLNVTSDWFTTSSNRRRAEFRIDLVDGSGNAVSHSPAIALVNGGGESSMLKFYNPKAQGSWGAATQYINGDKQKADIVMSEGWHTLYIKCTNGVITYYFDSMKLGNCTIPQKEVYPSYVALNAYNYEAPYAIIFDSLSVYDGAVSPPRELSTEKQDARDERLASQYAQKRSSWTEQYTSNGVLTKSIPERYWDY